MLMVGSHRRARALLLLALGLAACSNGGTSATSSASTVAQPSTGPSTANPASASAPVGASTAGSSAGDAITIQGFAFTPATLTVSVGSSVTWTNRDSAGHTVTADDTSFDSGTLQSGASFTQTFAKAGTFAYHCSIHSRMVGTIVVH